MAEHETVSNEEVSQQLHLTRRSTRSGVVKTLKRSAAHLEAVEISTTARASKARTRTTTTATVSSSTSTATITTTTATATARTKRKKNSSYVGPEKYAHLKGVPDAIDHKIICLFIGLNPGIRTAEVGHAYSHPANRFWKFLHSSGCTPDRLLPSTDDQLLPSQYALGCTNIVARATASQAELSDEELDAGVPELERKLRKYRAEAVCIVGKGIWDSIYRTKHNGQKVAKSFTYGWQDECENMGWISKGAKLDDEGNIIAGAGCNESGMNMQVEERGWEGAKVFVVPSTSGLVTIPQVTMREIWGKLGDWINKRRCERGIQVGK